MSPNQTGVHVHSVSRMIAPACLHFTPFFGTRASTEKRGGNSSPRRSNSHASSAHSATRSLREIRADYSLAQTYRKLIRQALSVHDGNTSITESLDGFIPASVFRPLGPSATAETTRPSQEAGRPYFTAGEGNLGSVVEAQRIQLGRNGSRQSEIRSLSSVLRTFGKRSHTAVHAYLCLDLAGPCDIRFRRRQGQPDRDRLRWSFSRLSPAHARPSKRLTSSRFRRSASNGSGRRAEMDQCTFQGGVASSRSKACKRRATTACACCADDCPSYSLHLRNIADVVAYPGHDEPRLRLCLALPASALLAFTLPPNSSPSNFVHHVMHIHSEMEKAARILRGTLTFCLARTSSGRQRSG